MWEKQEKRRYEVKAKTQKKSACLAGFTTSQASSELQILSLLNDARI